MVLNTARADSSIKPFAVLFILLNVLDLALTYWVLSLGGLEVNPIMASWMELGMPAAVSVKLGASVLLAGLLWHFRQRVALKLGAFLMLGVCLFNFIGLASMVV